MKVYINGYKDHWISPHTIVAYMFFWTPWSKCSRKRSIINDIEWVDSPAWADKLADRITWISNTIKWLWDKVDYEIKYVKIDRYDTWSMDHTLAYIILPMLEQLKAIKHGSPFVDDEDVPVHLQSEQHKRAKKSSKKAKDLNTHAVNMGSPYYMGEDDTTLHDRWDWVLDEMIWAFEQMCNDNKGEDQYWDHTGSHGNPWERDYVAPRCDWAGLRAHEDRMKNGFRLFGKYYLALWD
jgi:hypothetical protein